jgi:hypothetical protein
LSKASSRSLTQRSLLTLPLYSAEKSSQMLGRVERETRSRLWTRIEFGARLATQESIGSEAACVLASTALTNDTRFVSFPVQSPLQQIPRQSLALGVPRL